MLLFAKKAKWLMLRFLSPVLVLLVWIQAQGQVVPQARQVVQTIEELRAVGLPNFEDPQNGPPARVPGLLRKLNQQLRELIVASLSDRKRRPVVSEDSIFDELRAAGWNEIPRHKWNAYGEISQISFDWKTGYDPAVLIVSTQLWIPCGADPDSAIYVFRAKENEWEMAISAEADFDAADGPEESGLQYELAPPDSNGEWFLVIARTPPTCRSSPGTLRYKVLRPGPSADQPRILLDRREPSDQRFEPRFRLQAETDWFSVTTGRERKLDREPGVLISRYEVHGDTIRRLHPLALTPEDFLDTWAQLDWGEAVRWTTDSAGINLQQWHTRLNQLPPDAAEFESVQLCPKQGDSDNSWIVDLWLDKKQTSSGNDERLYIRVSEKNHVFYMDAIHTTRPPGCSGKTRHRTLTNWELPDW
jgi:hypothetical protein